MSTIACFSFLVRFFFLHQELCFELTKCQLEIEAVKGKIKFFRDVLKLEKMNVKKKIFVNRNQLFRKHKLEV